MADSILRLRVESQEYDAKLKRATEGLRQFAEECRKSDTSLNTASQDTLEYVSALGQMDTVSKTATGSLAEMRKTFIELSVQYKQLTDAEKQTPFGQALSSSLDQLKDRIQDSKSQIDSAKNALDGGSGSLGGALESITGKFGMSIQSLASWGTALMAGKGALDVAKDAFFASEATVDEWGRTMDAGKSLYEGFLVALNTGDISGYLANMGKIVTAAQAAYDAMDRLGTMQTIQAPQISAQRKENERLRNMLRQGVYIKPDDGRLPAPGLKDGQQLTKEQLQIIQKQYQGGIKKEIALLQNEVSQQTTAIGAVRRRWAAELGMSEKEFEQGTSSMAEFEKRTAGYAQYEKYREEHTYTPTRSAAPGAALRSVYDGSQNPYEAYKAWGVFRVDGERYKELVNLIVSRDQKQSSIYNLEGQMYRDINRSNGFSVRQIMNGGGGGGTGGSGRTVRGGRTGGSTAKLTPAQQATADIDKAEKDYATTLEIASQKVSAQTISVIDGNRQMVNAEQKLADAYLKAYTITKDEKYLTAFQATAEKYNTKKDDLDKTIEENKKHEQAAKEYEAAEQKRAATRYLWNTGSMAGVNSYISERQTGIGMAEIGSSDYIKQMANLADANAYKNLMQEALQQGMNDLVLDSSELWRKIINGEDIDDNTWATLVEKINEKLKEQEIDPIELKFSTGDIVKTAKDTEEGWKAAAQAVKAVGGALAQIEDPGAKIAGLIGQAVANIALGFAQATAASSKAGVFGWIAAIAGGMATMISTISAIHNATGYAEGGIVKGNRYSGDLLDGPSFGINAGELVLNRAQQGNLASQLSGSSQMLRLSATITGEDLRLVLNNNSRRTGRGEYVTTNFR